jgi:hypothetical protein
MEFSLLTNGLVEVNCFSNGVVCGIYGGNELQPQPTLKNGDCQLPIQNRMSARTATHAVLEVRRALLGERRVFPLRLMVATGRVRSPALEELGSLDA